MAQEEIMVNNQERFMNPYTDFGFKKLFGTEPNKDILMHSIILDIVIIMDWRLMFAGLWLCAGSKRPRNRDLSMHNIWSVCAMIVAKVWMKTNKKLWNGIVGRPVRETLKPNTLSVGVMNTAMV